jgi:hypothetical protein
MSRARRNPPAMNDPFTNASGTSGKRKLIDLSLLLAVGCLFVWAILL